MTPEAQHLQPLPSLLASELTEPGVPTTTAGPAWDGGDGRLAPLAAPHALNCQKAELSFQPCHFFHSQAEQDSEVTGVAPESTCSRREGSHPSHLCSAWCQHPQDKLSAVAPALPSQPCPCCPPAQPSTAGPSQILQHQERQGHALPRKSPCFLFSAPTYATVRLRVTGHRCVDCRQREGQQGWEGCGHSGCRGGTVS